MARDHVVLGTRDLVGFRAITSLEIGDETGWSFGGLHAEPHQDRSPAPNRFRQRAKKKRKKAHLSPRDRIIATATLYPVSSVLRGQRIRTPATPASNEARKIAILAAA